MSAASASAMDNQPFLVFDVADKRWLTVPGLQDLCASASRAVLTRILAGIDQSRIEIGFTFTDNEAIQALNRAYRQKDKPTNILSFPLIADFSRLPTAAPLLLGDLVLAYETVETEASQQGLPFAGHCLHLVVHGLLHLLGYDHGEDRNDEDARGDEMERLEVEILAGLGVANPYITSAATL